MSENIGDTVGQSMLNGLVPGAKKEAEVPPADDRYNDRGFKPHPDDLLFDAETGEVREPSAPKAKAAKFKVPTRVVEELLFLCVRRIDIDKLDFNGARTLLADAISAGRTRRSWGEQLITEMEAMQPDTPDHLAIPPFLRRGSTPDMADEEAEKLRHANAIAAQAPLGHGEPTRACGQ